MKRNQVLLKCCIYDREDLENTTFTSQRYARQSSIIVHLVTYSASYFSRIRNCFFSAFLDYFRHVHTLNEHGKHTGLRFVSLKTGLRFVALLPLLRKNTNSQDCYTAIPRTSKNRRPKTKTEGLSMV